MSDDSILRQEIRHSLSGVRGMIRSYSGLYSSEDLARDVLKICDDMAQSSQSTPRLKEARSLVQERCVKLVRDADRFSARDPAVIAASRAQAVASIDVMQDALFEMRKAEIAAPRIGALLRRRSL
ncbi:hypothetical protein AA309_18275 [Microvirga vignae]|uniref:Uncharacterized protein n=1 Tax=Microvirga vignae TaxID=1225564 RepID=A0A0H1R9H8_9HYPH|nr:hypothetical protein [Microvirga vignae]KLK91813.1 hypothetical protein AA309_18275 [Microvirga vignae]